MRIVYKNYKGIYGSFDSNESLSVSLKRGAGRRGGGAFFVL